MTWIILYLVGYYLGLVFVGFTDNEMEDRAKGAMAMLIWPLFIAGLSVWFMLCFPFWVGGKIRQRLDR